MTDELKKNRRSQGRIVAVPQQANFKRNIRGLRISLRLALILFLLIGAICGWLGREYSIVSTEERALNRLKQVYPDLLVHYDYQRDYESEIPADPPAPSWLRKILGDQIFTRVNYLSLELTPDLEEIDLCDFKSLESVRLTADASFDGRIFWYENTRFPDSLRSLNISGLDLSRVKKIKNLEELRVWNGFQNAEPCVNLEFLSNSSSLLVLGIYNCPNIYDLEGLDALVHLKDLALSGRMNTANEIAKLKKLEVLELTACRDLCDISFLRNLPHLSTLELNADCLEETEFAVLSSSPRLADLQSILISSAEKITSLEFLDAMSKLENVSIYNCKSLESLRGLEGKKELASLALYDCSSLDNLDGIEASTKLKYIELYMPLSLSNIDVLGSLSELQEFELCGADNLTTLDGIANLKLSTMKLEECSQLENVEGLAGAPNLKSLGIDGSQALASLRGIESLQSLESVTIHGCESLESIAELFAIKSLKEATVVGCDALPIEEVKQLEAALPPVKQDGMGF